ncbi:YnfA family protein [Prosthecomicrobium sp. N25]|uniref:YnfA family protein n=1 Tax=Prosthecomicrobium sp. N25 TaxID=3129254 RepID=UPI003077F30F
MTALLYAAAAAAEIAGCFAVWSWWRLGRSALWLVPGLAALALFAWLLALVPVSHAGRAFAAYGGVYIAASLVWMRLVENKAPDAFDLGGAALCLLGALVILMGPRG